MNEENTTNIYQNLEDEMLKLLAIVSVARHDNGWIAASYIEEKLIRALKGVPIVLHPTLAHRYKELTKGLFEQK